jgi:hypothetical protein
VVQASGFFSAIIASSSASVISLVPSLRAFTAQLGARLVARAGEAERHPGERALLLGGDRAEPRVLEEVLDPTWSRNQYDNAPCLKDDDQDHVTLYLSSAGLACRGTQRRAAERLAVRHGPGGAGLVVAYRDVRWSPVAQAASVEPSLAHSDRPFVP